MVFSPCSKGFGEIRHVAGSAESALWRTQALEMGFSAKQLFVSINKYFSPSLPHLFNLRDCPQHLNERGDAST